MIRPPPVLDSLRTRLRRAQLIMGLGFASLVLGVLLFAGLAVRLSDLLVTGGPGWLAALLGALVVRLWVVLLLPALAYALARAFSLGPWTTAIGAAATGEAFLLALDAITPGFAALLAQPRVLLVRALTLGLGIALTGWAVRRARAAAHAAEQRALEAAASRKSEYEAFLAESERIAEQREASTSASPMK